MGGLSTCKVLLEAIWQVTKLYGAGINLFLFSIMSALVNTVFWHVGTVQ